ncbi:hypothetical protein MtrunA17_Chr2g0313581 [Medicago truncatula]|uniref:Uncharacterized protein n=1 Tax=Medicago truncatula TaxID=3880 RepID=A0A396J9D2_MEDTR|nr:hypothetical protein MtrunA17_Chr2g0313581 [Medicago truncatula]
MRHIEGKEMRHCYRKIIRRIHHYACKHFVSLGINLTSKISSVVGCKDLQVGGRYSDG